MITFTGECRDSEKCKKTREHPGYREDDRSSPLHRQLIGYIGLVFPVILIFMVICRDKMAYWEKLDSVSAYYYSGAVAVFVGMLVSLALFLFTYRGFRNRYNRVDRLVSAVAAAAALGVAVFPTRAPEDVTPLTWWTPLSGKLHLGSAIVLFLMFAVFALFLFPIRAEGREARPGKRRRNRVYYSCGLLILAGIAWAVINKNLDRSIFWPESLALFAFAVSWLVKGRVDASISSAVHFLFGRKSSKAE